MSFKCARCGNCCAARGRVQLRPEEVAPIAKFLALDLYTFTKHYTRLSPTRADLELTDHPDGSCIMLTPAAPASPERLCRIHPVKPKQCRDFPHTWRTDEAAKMCKGLVC